MPVTIRTKYREPRAKRDWPLHKRIGKKTYQIDTVSVKKPSQETLKQKRKKENVIVVKRKHPALGYKVNANYGPTVTKYAEYKSPKISRKKKKTVHRPSKKSKHRTKKRKTSVGFIDEMEKMLS